MNFPLSPLKSPAWAVLLLMALLGPGGADGEDLGLPGLEVGRKGAFTWDGLRFSVGLFDVKWSQTGQATLAAEGGFPSKEEDGIWTVRGQLRPPGTDGPVLLEERLAPTSAGTLKAHYVLSHSTGVPLSAYLVVNLPVVLAGRPFLLDGQKHDLPSEAGPLTLLDEKGLQERTLALPYASGQVILHGTFSVQVQDLRRKQSEVFAVRLGFGSGGVLKNAGLAVEIARQAYVATPLPLGSSANRGLRDEVAHDGLGGWTDQGPENDMSPLHPGKLTAAGIAFDVADPAANGGKAALVLGGGKRAQKDLPASIAIPVPDGTAWKNLYLLHAASSLPASGQPVGRVHARYVDGTESSCDVVSGQDVGDWWAPTDLPNGAVGWKGENLTNPIGLYVSRFPLEAKPLASLQLDAAGAGMWMVAAASGSADPLVPAPSAIPLTIEAGPKWTPYAHSLEIEKGGVFDFSFLADAPAGKYGAVAATPQGHFEFANRPGVRVRFYGGNIVSSATAPDHAGADRLAERLVRSGYNVVRLQNYDSAILKPGGKPNEFDPDQLDRVDYLFQALKSRGIYVLIDLFTVRGFAPGELAAFGLDPKLGRAETRAPFKVLLPISEPAFESWKGFARNLLAHGNPYTGLTWAKDPALVGICTVNETMLTPVSVAAYPEIEKQYQDAFTAWKKTAPGAEGVAPDALYVRFLTETQARSDARMQEFLRSLAVTTPLTGVNFRSFQSETFLREHYDYVDTHQYWDHPRFVGKGWKFPFLFSQGDSLRYAAEIPRTAMPARIPGKPFALSEFDFVLPNRYRAEGGVLIPAYASLQDWDALYNYNYANSAALAVDGDIAAGDHGFPFSLAGDPVGLLADRAAALLFLRRDIAPAPHSIVFEVGSPGAFEGGGKEFPPAFSHLGLVTRIGSRTAPAGPESPSALVVPEGTAFPSKRHAYPADKDLAGNLEKDGILPQGAVDEAGQRFTSETGQIELRGADGTLKVVTDRSELFVLAAGQRLEGSRMTVQNGPEFGTVSAISVDGQPLASSRRLLLLHLSDALLAGTRFSDGDEQRLEVSGQLPFLVRKATADITLRLAPGIDYDAWAVDATGKRLSRVPLEKTDRGWNLKVDTASPEGARLAYEIVSR